MRDIYRSELKYTLSDYHAELLRLQLRQLLETDPHADAEGGYQIRSLYFDDLDYTAFREKQDGVKERTKFRLRYYNWDESYLVLEKKERNGDLCRKSTLRVTREQAEALIRGDDLEPGSELETEYHLLHELKGLRPTVLVDYYRYAFFYPISDVRLTLDLNLTTPLWSGDFFARDLPAFPAYEPGEALLELKYNEAAPDFLRDLLSAVPMQRTANSKFARCMSLMNE